MMAARSLGEIGKADERIVPALTKALDDKNAVVRAFVEKTLGKLQGSQTE